MNKKRIRSTWFVNIILIFTLVLMPFNTLDAYGAEYVKGQSIIAEDQVKASIGLNFPGLNITWLDIGDSHVQSYSQTDRFSEGIFTLNLSDKTICFDTTGKIIAAGDYNGILEFSDGMAKVYKYIPCSEPVVPGRIMAPPGEIEGFINIEGNEAIPLGKLNGMGDKFHEGFAIIGMDYEQNKGFINKKGEIVIPQIYKDTANFSEGLAAVQGIETDLWGYIDKDGELIIPMIYEYASLFREEAAYVVIENKNYPNGYGSSFLINRSGERLTPLWQYGRYWGEYMREGLIRALSTYGPSSNEYIVMLNKYGAEVIPSSLHINYLSSFNEGHALIIAHNNNGTAVGLVKKLDNIEAYNNRKIIRVFIDEQLLDFADTDPIIENSRTLVPMRAIFEALGVEVEWDDANKTAIAMKDDTTMSLKIGDNIGYINNEQVELDVPAIIKNSRNLVPLRFVAEAFSAEVTWSDAERAVSINTSVK